MIFSRLVTLIRRAPGVDDEYGDQALAAVSNEAVYVELQQTASTEIQVDRDTVIADWLVMFPPETVISAVDQIAVDDARYEIVGAPELVFHPWAGTADHWEARMRLVVG